MIMNGTCHKLYLNQILIFLARFLLFAFQHSWTRNYSAVVYALCLKTTSILWNCKTDHLHLERNAPRYGNFFLQVDIYFLHLSGFYPAPFIYFFQRPLNLKGTRLHVENGSPKLSLLVKILVQSTSAN